MAYSDIVRNSDVQPATTARTWIAVLDGGRAAIFRNEGFDDAPAVSAVLTMENEKSGEIGRDKPGRSNTPDGGRTAAPFTDQDDKRELAFVDKTLAQIEALARGGRFDRLVLLAPAQWIRRFRELAPTARAKLVAIRIGDFAHARVERIEEAFKQAMQPTPRSTMRERG